MKLAVLYSGGKDSNYALYLAQRHGHEIACLVSMKSKNQESYMFQTPGNDFVKMQAECLDIPLIHFETQGEKEREVEDMRDALLKAKEEFGIKGVVTGAIKSAYQAQRVQKVCLELDLECYNPLWQIDEEEFIESLIHSGFEIQIIGIFSYPFSKEWLSRKVDRNMLKELKELNNKYHLSVAFEGGEAETFITNGPNFKKKIILQGTPIMDSENSGVYQISACEVIEK